MTPIRNLILCAAISLVSVLVHELGHALVPLLCGVPVEFRVFVWAGGFHFHLFVVSFSRRPLDAMGIPDWAWGGILSLAYQLAFLSACLLYARSHTIRKWLSLIHI